MITLHEPAGYDAHIVALKAETEEVVQPYTARQVPSHRAIFWFDRIFERNQLDVFILDRIDSEVSGTRATNWIYTLYTNRGQVEAASAWSYFLGCHN